MRRVAAAAVAILLALLPSAAALTAHDGGSQSADTEVRALWVLRTSLTTHKAQNCNSLSFGVSTRGHAQRATCDVLRAGAACNVLHARADVDGRTAAGCVLMCSRVMFVGLARGT